MLRYDVGGQRITKIRKVDSSLFDFTRAMKRQVALLKHPIRVISRSTDSLGTLKSLLEDEGVFVEGKARIRDSMSHDNREQSLGGTEPSMPGHEEQTDDKSASDDTPVQLERLWEALIEAESSILPIVTVIGDPVVMESSGIVVIPVGEASRPFDFQDDEPVQIAIKNREGQWQPYGNLDNRRTRPGALAVVLPRGKGSFMPPVNSSLQLVNKASKASCDKRQGAIQRILGGTSVCHDLIRYFACADGLTNRTARFATRFEELDRYNLNPEQRDALETALSASPLSMIQGPPGTGKTSVISAAVHYIASNYRSARILVVSQSHEAIDHATEQIVKRFRKHGEEPSLVRVGRRAAVSDNLISFHSESLQGEYRERFRLSLADRIAPVGARLGLSEIFVGALTVLRVRLVPILRQLVGNSGSGEDPSGQ
jgi:hypothetical protein